LVYPGILIALIAAWALAWVRESARGALNGGGALSSPLRSLGELRTTFERESVVPEGARPDLIAAATTATLVFPLLALVLLPVPGNPLVTSLGLTGDLAAEGALLLGMPLARLLLGWATPSPYTRLAADRGVRLLAGAALPMALALAANAQQFSTLALDHTRNAAKPSTLGTIAFVLAAIAFAWVVPALARMTLLRQPEGELDQVTGESSELSGRDLAYFRIGEALQLAATAAFFIAVFLLPIFPGVRAGAELALLWILGMVLVAAAVGVADAFRTRALTQRQESPLDWWAGWPLLLALAALVASAWATRGL
ncbi:MAG: NADH-quinone oxidoreductase subunit H, partial [Ktedonobacterales bacterium]|nr:NADH-quinone oxidoreductase subunit H [Ktedonobacterales bacterium]